MAQTESKIKLIFEGVERGVVAAAAKSAAAIRSLDDDNSRLSKSADRAGSALGVMGKGMLALGAANGAVQVVGGVAGALTQLAPAALLLPGALLAAGAAMGTFKIATAGMGDALSAGLSGDMAKFAEATKDMAPEMQAAAKSVASFKPQIDDLKKTVQGNFWGQFAGDIKGLGGGLLPVMKHGLGDIATQMGVVTKGAVQAAQTPFFRGAVASILHSTAGFFHEVGKGAGDVLTGIVGIGEVGATYLPRLGTAIAGVAKKFGDWAQSAEGQDKIKKLIDGAIQGFKDLGGIVKNIGSILSSVFRGLGADMSSPLAKIEELTGKVADFLKSVKGQDALRALGSALQTVGEQVGRVLDAGLDELGPTLVALAPPVKEIAKALGDLLVGAIRTLGPMIRGVADTFAAFPGSAGAAATAVAGFWAAVKVMKLTNTVTDLLGMGKAFGGVAPAAEAGGKTAGIAWGKGFTGGLALAGAGIGATIILDKVLPADAAKTHGSQIARDMLHEMAAVFQGGGSAFQTLNVAQWISNPISMAVEVGKRKLMELFGFKPPPPPALHIDTQPATKEFNAWNDHVGDSIATANLDADPNKAQGVVHDWVGGVSRTRGTASLDADASRGNNVLAGWKGSAHATVGTASLNANPGQANSTTSSWQGRANGTVGTARLAASPHEADGTVAGWKSRASATTATARLLAVADTRQATADLARAAQNRTMTITAIVRQRALPPGHSATGGAVIGGQVAQHFGVGGPVSGPGTGISDSVPAMLSNGEYVATARQVRNAGGPAAFGQLMSALGGGMRSSARAAMRAPSAASSGGSGGGTFQLVVGPGADAAAGAFIAGLIRTGKLQMKAA